MPAVPSSSNRRRQSATRSRRDGCEGERPTPEGEGSGSGASIRSRGCGRGRGTVALDALAQLGERPVQQGAHGALGALHLDADLLRGEADDAREQDDLAMVLVEL